MPESGPSDLCEGHKVTYVPTAIFRSSLACWKVVGLKLFCSGPSWGPRAKRSGDGHDFRQTVQLQVAFGAPLGGRDMP